MRKDRVRDDEVERTIGKGKRRMRLGTLEVPPRKRFSAPGDRLSVDVDAMDLGHPPIGEKMAREAPAPASPIEQPTNSLQPGVPLCRGHDVRERPLAVG